MFSENTNNMLIAMLDGSCLDKKDFTPDVLNQLLIAKYVRPTVPDFHCHTYCLTEGGTAYAESIIKAEIERKKQFKHDWWLATYSALTGVVTGAIAGVLATIIYNAITK